MDTVKGFFEHMKNWLNFSTIKRWSVDNAGATDCTKECSGCKKSWAKLVYEGRGSEPVHMLMAEKKTPCGQAFEMVCDTCLQKMFYECSICGGVFRKGRTDQEAFESYKKVSNQPGLTPDDLERVELVCDNCFKEKVIQKLN